MRFKGFGGLGKIIGAVLACVLIAQFAMAVEGMGSHRGSFVFFPYWTTDSPFLTVWRISNALDLNDATLTPIVADPEGKEGPNYRNNPVQLHIFFMETPDCDEADQYFPFSPNDYRLIVVNNVRGIRGEGWAYGYATLFRDPFPTQVLLWDRFFSDTVIVNVADGWARGWHNWQQWGRKDFGPLPPAAPAGFRGAGAFPTAQVVVDNPIPAGNAFCDYSRDTTADFNPSNPGNAPLSNDVCVYGPDNVGFNVSIMTAAVPVPGNDPAASGIYWPMTPASNFFSSYYTEAFRFGGGRGQPTEISITPIEIWEPFQWCAPPPGPCVVPAPGVTNGTFGESAIFTSDGIPDYTYDAILFDADENTYSVPVNTVECQEVLTIHELTDDGSVGLPQGFVHFWALTPPGDPDLQFGDWDAAAVLSWDRFPQGKSDLGWGYWTTHDKTSVDDRDLETHDAFGAGLEDFDPEA